MGFMDSIKQGAEKMADGVNRGVANLQSGPTAPGSGANPEALLRDLGALTYRELSGTLDDAGRAEKDRVVAELGELAPTGQLNLALHTTPAPPPPPPGQPPPGGETPPPPPPAGQASPAPAPAPPPDPSTVAPPPPPPSPDALRPPDTAG